MTAESVRGLADFRSAVTLFALAGGLSGLANLAGAPILAAITESLPKRVRAGGLSLIYALAIAIFGGSAQFNVAWLTGVTHSNMAPAWYMAIGVAVGLIAMSLMRETAPARQQV